VTVSLWNRWDKKMEQQTTIDMVNGLSEIADYMQDEELTTALTFIAKIIVKPDIPLNVATVEIVRLQAIAAKMSLKATWMANVDKSDRGKKNLYYTAAESINNLVSALKYIIR
jgi:predicted S18 family serine protease